jgi:galactose mutarotase-like enzyme
MDAVELKAGEATARIALVGAEPVSWRVGGTEYLWSGDPAHWNRHAPILFPVVGASAGGVVRVAGRDYPMPQHGFARDLPFAVVAQDAASATLRLEDTPETRAHYPFAFRLDLAAALRPDGGLVLTFTVSNTGATVLPYALGFHPAFPWPFDGGPPQGPGHAVLFEAEERAEVPEVAAGGLLARTGRRLPLDGRRLDLDPALFTEALVFLDARSRAMRFASPTGRAVAMTVEDFPHLAVWTRGAAPFVSLECWTGHADWEGFAGELEERDSMRSLAPDASAVHRVTLAVEQAGERS